MYILIKTEQIVNVTCKMILMWSTSDLTIAMFPQNLFVATFYEKKCFLQRLFRILSTFLVHLSCYTIALMGIDRYIRIRYYVKFKSMWITKVVTIAICMSFSLLCLKQSCWKLVCLSGKDNSFYSFTLLSSLVL